MAFFTRVNLNVPVLPPEDLGTENTCSAVSHRRHASEPVYSEYATTRTGTHSVNSTTRPNSVPSGGTSTVKISVTDRNTSDVTSNISADIPVISSNKSMNTKGRLTESNAQNSENCEGEVTESSSEKNGNEEPKRYEYVVDRVLGVEV